MRNILFMLLIGFAFITQAKCPEGKEACYGVAKKTHVNGSGPYGEPFGAGQAPYSCHPNGYICVDEGTCERIRVGRTSKGGMVMGSKTPNLERQPPHLKCYPYDLVKKRDTFDDRKTEEPYHANH